MPPAPITPSTDEPDERGGHGAARVPLPRSYWTVLGVLVLFSLANSSDTFILLRASDLGYSPWAVVMVYALFNVTYAALSYPAGVLSDRLGRWRIIAVGWVIYAVVYAGFALLPATHAWGMWPLMALYGIYMALTDGVGKALIADHAPKHAAGAAMGIFYALTGLTTLVASLIAGLVWDRSGPHRRVPDRSGIRGGGVGRAGGAADGGAAEAVARAAVVPLPARHAGIMFASSRAS